jgi:hypothetical protein
MSATDICGSTSLIGDCDNEGEGILLAVVVVVVDAMQLPFPIFEDWLLSVILFCW